MCVCVSNVFETNQLETKHIYTHVLHFVRPSKPHSRCHDYVRAWFLSDVTTRILNEDRVSQLASCFGWQMQNAHTEKIYIHICQYNANTIITRLTLRDASPKYIVTVYDVTFEKQNNLGILLYHASPKYTVTVYDVTFEKQNNLGTLLYHASPKYIVTVYDVTFEKQNNLGILLYQQLSF